MKYSVFELAYRHVYPAVKRRLVEILYNEYKLTQQEIARLLHISQSAASRYKNLARGKLIDLSRFKDIDEEIHRLAEKLVREKPDKYRLVNELVRITLKALARGYICSYHRMIDKDIDPDKCRICLDLFKNIV